MEQAEQVVQNIKNELGEEIDIGILKTYESDEVEKQDIEIASFSTNLVKEIKEYEIEKEKIKQATVNGVYLAVNPVIGNITSRYGAVERIRDHTHQGLDIAAKLGTTIKAVAGGTITYAGWMNGYGNFIKIDHGNGVETYYGHCSKIYVKKGQEVEAGDKIGAVGSTGNSTGPHLHLEVRLNGKVLNPLNYLYK